MSADPALLLGWLSARSIARGLPPPVAELGGFRVDTRSDGEVCRWVFPAPCEGLSQLGRQLCEPRYLLKLCGCGEALLAALDSRWRLQAPSYFMRGPAAAPGVAALSPGYMLEHRRDGATRIVEVLASDGSLAASGFAAEAAGVYAYDRIITAPEHRRKGLGRAVMHVLRETGPDGSVPELLVATEEGRALYAALGWITLSPYATGEIAHG